MVLSERGPVRKPWVLRGRAIFSNKAHSAVMAQSVLGPYPQHGWDFPEEIPEKFRKDPGNALRAFPGISLESTAGMPQAL